MIANTLVAPFEAALGARFAYAPEAVRVSHRAGSIVRLRGEAEIAPAASPLAHLIAHLFGIPREGASVPVTVTKRRHVRGETWERDFGGRVMKSRLRVVRQDVVRESFGPFAFDLALDADRDALAMCVIAWRIGPVPLPRALAPSSNAKETQDEQGRFCFDVPIALPLIGRLTHYKGWLEIEAPNACSPQP